MSLNLNLNIIGSLQQEQRGIVRFDIPATVYCVGAGGWGGNASASLQSAAGGGGGGAVISSSINLTPNITHNIFVGSAINGSNGGTTNFLGYDGGDSYNRNVTISAQGGRVGVTAAPNFGSNGGNSGTGSITFPEGTTIIPGFTGGNGVSNLPSGQGGGGGAGSSSTGSNARNVPPVFGGNGGGITSTPLFNAGAGGGGGANTNAGGTPGFVGGSGTSVAGTGGQGANGGGVAGAATNGAVMILFDSSYNYDVTVTNATSGSVGGGSLIYYLFQSPTGSFRFTRPFPYNPQP